MLKHNIINKITVIVTGAKLQDGYKGWHKTRKMAMYSSIQYSYF